MGKIVCSGPVIIEDDKVLLIKEKKSTGITPWFFPGGKLEKGENLEQACVRETKEEVGLDIQIIEKLDTLTDKDGDDTVFLHHYLAKKQGEVKPGPTVVEWAWHDIHNLPKDCAQNIYQIIKDYEQT